MTPRIEITEEAIRADERALIRARIEALIETNQGMDPRTRVGMWEVLALLEEK